MQGRNIAEADEQFGMGRNELIVQERQDARRPIAAAQTDDGLDGVVGKGFVDVPCPQPVRAGQITVKGRYGFPDFQFIAEGTQEGEALGHVGTGQG